MELSPLLFPLPQNMILMKAGPGAMEKSEKGKVGEVLEGEGGAGSITQLVGGVLV